MKGFEKKTRILIGIAIMFSLVCGCAAAPSPATAPSPAPAPASEPEEVSTPTPEAEAEPGMTDLFDYYGVKIDELAVDFPQLQYDDSYKTAKEGTTEVSEPVANMEKMSDGLALAGPFFTIDKEGKVVGISYGGKTYCVCGIKVGMPMKEAAELAKSKDFEFNRVEITHGSAKYVAIYDNADMELCIVSDADGDTNKMEESDVTGNVDDIFIINK